MRSVQTLGSTQGQRTRASPACLALTGTVARLLSKGLSVTPSTFLSPFAPRPLRRFSARMGTLTPRQVSCPTEVSPLHVTRRLRPFCLQPPNAPHRGFHTLPLSSMGLPSRGQASPLACRLTGLVRPNRVRQTADWSLTSGCSPPRLSATQLPSVSRPESVCLERTCTSIRVRSRAHKPGASAPG